MHIHSFDLILTIVVLFFFLLAIVTNKRIRKNINILLITKFRVNKHEKGLLFKDNDLVKLIEPGCYYLFDPTNSYSCSIYDQNIPEFTTELAEFIIAKREDILKDNIVVADISDNQVGIVYYNNNIISIIEPNTKKLYWNTLIDVKVDKIQLEGDFSVPVEMKNILFDNKNNLGHLLVSFIYNYEIGLLFNNGIFIKNLEPGIHVFWKHNNCLSITNIDTRLQNIEISGQEIMTQDKVSLRINLSANYRIIDPLKAVTKLKDYKDYIYKELQFALRDIVATYTLDNLLAQKHELNKMILVYLKEKHSKYGIDIENTGIKDVILPGDMREIMNQVVEAEKQAQANIIKRREETAATRSSLNTAKLLEENPTLMRLKELEMLEKITSKVNSLNVYGGIDGLIKELVKIKN